MKLSPTLRKFVRCPKCLSALSFGESTLTCLADQAHRFPVMDGTPILIDDSNPNGLFTAADFLDRRELFFKSRSRFARTIDRMIPSLAINVGSTDNFRRFTQEILKNAVSPKVLVVGAGEIGQGLDALIAEPHIQVLESDVALGERTQIVADCHAIPFETGTFDGIVAQAVLEHVWSPAKCVAEMSRVLRPSGVVYVEIPFMQPVHGGRFDFTRLTHSGLRGLMAEFDELKSGAVGGPGMAFAYSGVYLTQSLFRTRTGRKLANRLGRMVFSWFKYLDLVLASREASLDSAASLYFLGRLAAQTTRPRSVIAGYRGGA